MTSPDQVRPVAFSHTLGAPGIGARTVFTR